MLNRLLVFILFVVAISAAPSSAVVRTYLPDSGNIKGSVRNITSSDKYKAFNMEGDTVMKQSDLAKRIEPKRKHYLQRQQEQQEIMKIFGRFRGSNTEKPYTYLEYGPLPSGEAVGYVNVFTRVSKYIPWLMERMNNEIEEGNQSIFQ